MPLAKKSLIDLSLFTAFFLVKTYLIIDRIGNYPVAYVAITNVRIFLIRIFARFIYHNEQNIILWHFFDNFILLN